MAFAFPSLRAAVPVPSASSGRAGRFPVSPWLPVLLAVALLPFAIDSDYLFGAILVPLLILSLAALGLNVLMGYAGQLSLGSAAFMAVGAFATYNLHLRVPGLPLLLALAGGGVIAGAAGVLFGLPSLRINGFYLIAATLAAQFFIPWLLTQYPWFSNGSASGVITAPPLRVGPFLCDSPAGRYGLTLAIVTIVTWGAANLVHGPAGRSWIAIRDMDLAAAAIGIVPARAKLFAFAVSSFILGIAGGLWAFAYLGTVEPAGFDLDRSFQILFIVIIGGMGSIRGNFFGAAFIVLLPVGLSIAASALAGSAVDPALLENIRKLLFGTLIIVFLVIEPDGLAHLADRALRTRLHWIGSEKIRERSEYP